MSANPARIELQPAFVLHARSYRETSLIAEVFSADHGRMGLMARGARRPKSPLRGLLNPFQPLRLSWAGRGELPTLTDADPGGLAAPLTGERVMAGFYVNELLLKLLQRGDPHPDLFVHYGSLLGSLSQGAPLEIELRKFELALLGEIGYALNLHYDAITHEAIDPDATYEFRVEQGAVRADESFVTPDLTLYAGKTLLAIGRSEI